MTQHQLLSRTRYSAVVAGRNALVLAGTVLVFAVLRIVFDGEWRLVLTEWRLIFTPAAIFGVLWFCGQFAYAFLKYGSNSQVEEILNGAASSADQTKNQLSGFVAMEYHSLILNPTYVIFVAPEGLYGWKVSGLATGANPTYFQPYTELLKEPELMHSRGAIKQLTGLRGGFFLPRAEIISADVIHKQKWGMTGIPHSGRIRLRLASGQFHEFILLGSVRGQQIQQEILAGRVLAAGARANVKS